jgi:hypothetical protein
MGDDIGGGHNSELLAGAEGNGFQFRHLGFVFVLMFGFVLVFVFGFVFMFVFGFVLVFGFVFVLTFGFVFVVGFVRLADGCPGDLGAWLWGLGRHAGRRQPGHNHYADHYPVVHVA